MSVDADLATLRVLTTGHWTTRAALARVEAELSRLREERDAARGELREMRDDRDEGWRQHNQAEIGRLNAEAKLRRAIATLEYMGGAELVVDELRHGSLPEPSEDEAWEKRSRER